MDAAGAVTWVRTVADSGLAGWSTAASDGTHLFVGTRRVSSSIDADGVTNYTANGPNVVRYNMAGSAYA